MSLKNARLREAHASCHFQKTAALNVRSRLHYSSEWAWIRHAMTGGCRPGPDLDRRQLVARFRLVAVTQFRRRNLKAAPQPVVHRSGSQTTARPPGPVVRQGRQVQSSGMAAHVANELVLSIRRSPSSSAAERRQCSDYCRWGWIVEPAVLAAFRSSKPRQSQLLSVSSRECCRRCSPPCGAHAALSRAYPRCSSSR